ncbi:hypothetical protein SOMG_02669 [Schizosaccharomyces osmophilus]|uniref:Uncharacterized protein n=1 Tax=Schizosaccharomyces osmophilus TaxID=2545709 RepID=A0AAF0AVP8_9SCHI|nr:uncharacterized protein SOMG_02669 [Schizosaccharomyces osmophilus]WBW73801.1 hypothetical protein SOMG_02669 [Schizosaccharomyces osmophilus]
MAPSRDSRYMITNTEYCERIGWLSSSTPGPEDEGTGSWLVESQFKQTKASGLPPFLSIGQ